MDNGQRRITHKSGRHDRNVMTYKRGRMLSTRISDRIRISNERGKHYYNFV